MFKNLALAAVSAAVICASASFPRLAVAQNAEPLKVAFVYVTPINDVGWTAQHDAGRRAMEAALGKRVKVTLVDSVAEGADAERVIRDLAVQGNQLIFTTSFGYMDPTLKVAREFPSVAFEHASGYKNAPNVGNYNARFYEGRYLAGMVAGSMTQTGTAGVVAAFPIPEVLQGINAFTLGMRAVNPKAQVKVVWTNTWYDPPKEKDAASALINQGADVLTHHNGSTATVQEAEARGKMSVAYHSDMRKYAPRGQLTSVQHHWGAFYTQVVTSRLNGTWRPSQNVLAGVREGFISLGTMSPAVPQSVVALVKERHQQIASGAFHPFSGPITDNEGKPRLASGSLSDKELGAMNYLVDGVVGALPNSR